MKVKELLAELQNMEADSDIRVIVQQDAQDGDVLDITDNGFNAQVNGYVLYALAVGS